MKQYEDELARKRMMADHELQRQVSGWGRRRVQTHDVTAARV